jgi:hypothetical protein
VISVMAPSSVISERSCWPVAIVTRDAAFSFSDSIRAAKTPTMFDRCSNDRKMRNRSLKPATAVAVNLVVSVSLAITSIGCRSVSQETADLDLGAAIDRLQRPLTADPAALYHVRVAASGGLRLAVLTSGEQGRLTVSEPFGSTVSLTSWSGSRPPTFLDLKHGCRLEASDLEQVLGIAAMPLPQAVRLLVGRLPAVDADRLSPRDDGKILVEGQGWAALVTVEPEPWRVVRVEEVGNRGERWHLKLGDHSLSVPGSIRLENRDGRWVELELVRLEWNDGGELPSLPDLPLCLVGRDP